MRPLRLCALCATASLLACGGKASPDGGRLDASVLDGGCAASVESWGLDPSPHVPVGSAITWSSNPPSSGPHYPVWAAFQEFSTPVPRGYYVHDLEHGAVVFLYNCALVDGGADGGGCAAITEVLRRASDSLPDDPICDPRAGVRVRTVVTPDPLITTPVAAAAWGFTYAAQCVDLPSLEAFAAEHYAHASENECANGVASF